MKKFKPFQKATNSAKTQSISLKMINSVFKHNMAFTAQATFLEQQKHLAFGQSAVKSKQVKLLLDEFPEHFIVNEGKDAKKFQGGGHIMTDAWAFPPFYISLPTFSLEALQLPTTTKHTATITEGASNAQFHRASILAHCRFNNQDSTPSPYDILAGFNLVKQEQFHKVAVQIDEIIIQMLILVPQYDRARFLHTYRFLFLKMLHTRFVLTKADTDPALYLYDHVASVDSEVYAMYQTSAETVSYMIPAILIIHLQYTEMVLQYHETIKGHVHGSGIVTDIIQGEDLDMPEIVEGLITLLTAFRTEISGEQSEIITRVKPRNESLVNVYKLHSIFMCSGVAPFLYEMMDSERAISENQIYARNVDYDAMATIVIDMHTAFDFTTVQVEVIFQMVGLTHSTMFGLVYKPDSGNVLQSMIATGVTGVCPESRDFLSLLVKAELGVDANAYFPASINVQVTDDDGYNKFAHWVTDPAFRTDFDGDSLMPYDNDDELESYSIFQTQANRKLQTSKKISNFIWNSFRPLLEKYFSEPMGIGSAEVTPQNWEEVLKHYDAVQARCDVMISKASPSAEHKQLVEKLLPLYKMYRSEFGDLIKLIKGKLNVMQQMNALQLNTLTGSGRSDTVQAPVRIISMHQTRVASQVLDPTTILRLTQGYMHQEQQYISNGYQKIKHSNAITLQCCKKTNDFVASIDGTYSSAIQQIMAYKESIATAVTAVDDVQLIPATFGTIMQTFLMHSVETRALDGVWQSQANRAFYKQHQRLFFDSLSSQMQQFMDEAPTLFIVRYDQMRLQADQKIPTEAVEPGEEKFSDRMYFMEPELSYIDTFQMNTVVAGVAMFLTKVQEDNKLMTEVIFYEMLRSKLLELPSIQLLSKMTDNHVFVRPYVTSYGPDVTLASVFTKAVALLAEVKKKKKDREIEKDFYESKPPTDVLIKLLTKFDATYPEFMKIGFSPSRCQSSVYQEKNGDIADIFHFQHGMEAGTFLDNNVTTTQNYMSMRDQMSFASNSLYDDTFINYTQVNVSGESFGLPLSAVDQEYYLPVIKVAATAVKLLLSLTTMTDENVALNIPLLIAYANIASKFQADASNITPLQVNDFFNLMVTKQPIDAKRYLVKYESPRQRLAFADYIENMTIVSSTVGAAVRTDEFVYKPIPTALNAEKPDEKTDVVSFSSVVKFDSVILGVKIQAPVRIHPATVFLAGASRFVSTLLSGQVPSFQTVTYKSDTFRNFKTSSNVIDVTSEFSHTSMALRPFWQIKHSATYTRRSIAPGIQLLRITRDKTDIIPLKSRTIQQLFAKPMSALVPFRDVNMLLATQQHMGAKQWDKNNNDRKEPPGWIDIKNFNPKSSDLYTSQIVSNKIVQLVTQNSIAVHGSQPASQRHVGVPFFTTVVRYHLTVIQGAIFQQAFANARDTWFRGLNPLLRHPHQIPQSFPILGVNYQNYIPLIKDENELDALNRVSSAWHYQAEDYFNLCVLKEDDIVRLREYKSKANFKTFLFEKEFQEITKLNPSEMLSATTYAARNQITGLDRVKYILQTSYYDFQQFFKNQAAGASTDVKTVFTMGEVYKLSIAKTLQSFKLTIAMYQDNPFVIESLMQVYFQSPRQMAEIQSVDIVQLQANMYDFVNSAKAAVVKKMTLTDLDAKNLHLIQAVPTAKFQHAVIPVFVDVLLVKQGCPIDPYDLQKRFIVRKSPEFTSLLTQNSQAANVQKISSMAAIVASKIDTKTGYSKKQETDRYKTTYAAMKTALETPDIIQLAPSSCTLWDLNQYKFVADPSLLFETFLETGPLTDSYDNTNHILQKMIKFKQDRYKTEFQNKGRICPQFAGFGDLSDSNGYANVGATLMDQALLTVRQLTEVEQSLKTVDIIRASMTQLVQDLFEASMFICNWFSIIHSGYSRAQIKGIRDSDNFTILTMIQAYVKEFRKGAQQFTSRVQTFQLKAPYIVPPLQAEEQKGQAPAADANPGGLPNAAPGGLPNAGQPNPAPPQPARVQEVFIPVYTAVQAEKIFNILRNVTTALERVETAFIVNPRLSAYDQQTQNTEENLILQQQQVVRPHDDVMYSTSKLLPLDNPQVLIYLKARDGGIFDTQVYKLVEVQFRSVRTDLNLLVEELSFKDATKTVVYLSDSSIVMIDGLPSAAKVTKEKFEQAKLDYVLTAVAVTNETQKSSIHWRRFYWIAMCYALTELQAAQPDKRQALVSSWGKSMFAQNGSTYQGTNFTSVSKKVIHIQTAADVNVL